MFYILPAFSVFILLCVYCYNKQYAANNNEESSMFSGGTFDTSNY